MKVAYPAQSPQNRLHSRYKMQSKNKHKIAFKINIWMQKNNNHVIQNHS